MLHAAMFTVDFLLYVLPIVFALMIAHDFIIYVGHQRRLVGVPVNSATPSKTCRAIAPSSKALFRATPQEPQESAPAQVEPQRRALPDLSQLKFYKLHSYDVVLLADLPSTPPAAVKRYKLRGNDCVRLADLEVSL